MPSISYKRVLSCVDDALSTVAYFSSVTSNGSPVTCNDTSTTTVELLFYGGCSGGCGYNGCDDCGGGGGCGGGCGGDCGGIE